MDPVEPGLACGSDTAHLSIFGYDPRLWGSVMEHSCISKRRQEWHWPFDDKPEKELHNIASGFHAKADEVFGPILLGRRSEFATQMQSRPGLVIWGMCTMCRQACLCRYYRGRGAFESMGAGLPMQPGDIAFKSNFATMNSEGVVIKRRADRQFEVEGPVLCQALDGDSPRFGSNRLSMYHSQMRSERWKDCS